MDDSEQLLTVQEVADFLKVSTKTVLHYIHINKIAAIKIGKDWRISKLRLQSWIESEFNSNKQNGTTESI